MLISCRLACYFPRHWHVILAHWHVNFVSTGMLFLQNWPDKSCRLACYFPRHWHVILPRWHVNFVSTGTLFFAKFRANFNSPVGQMCSQSHGHRARTIWHRFWFIFGVQKPRFLGPFTCRRLGFAPKPQSHCTMAPGGASITSKNKPWQGTGHK